jgi:hypothetical protein
MHNFHNIFIIIYNQVTILQDFVYVMYDKYVD